MIVPEFVQAAMVELDEALQNFEGAQANAAQVVAIHPEAAVERNRSAFHLIAAEIRFRRAARSAAHAWKQATK